MAEYLRTTGIALAGAILVALVVLATPTAAHAVGGEGEGWPSFNESDGCGSPWMMGPNVEASGWLPSSTVLRGPHADYFGRTIGQIWNSLAWWDVPMSNNESIRLHERLQPALGEVEVNLAQAASDGYLYNIVDRYTFGYAARTIGGRYRVSQHALGNAIDINSVSNPYTTGALRTNMPSWFVDSFSDAGFCWGGYWISVKDAMHYNWRGPAFTESITELPSSYPPLTSARSFDSVMHTATVPAPLASTAYRLVMDGVGDGAPDVVNVSSTVNGAVIDIVPANKGYLGCAVSRYPIGGIDGTTAAVNGDWDRDGGQDVWLIDDSDGITVTAYLRFGDFENSESASIDVPTGDHYLAADFDVDGWTDLFVVRVDGDSATLTVHDGESRFGEVLVTASIPAGPGVSYTVVDRDLDQVPDLFVVSPSGSTILKGSTGFTSSETINGFAGAFDDIAGVDFDGDGRHDLVTLDGTELVVHSGNSSLGLPVTSWFSLSSYSCSASALPYPYDGVFRDDDGSVHEQDIESIAETGITKGCNPPLKDKFCPRRVITRGELAAFLRRSLSLPGGSTDAFVDDSESIFHGDIDALASAGIVVPCALGSDHFCPDDPVTRDDMARFLVVAFDLPASDVDAFTDDDANVFEAEINALAAAGMTKGCNPPDNDLFCPDRDLPRSEMATFLIRVLKLVGG